LRPRWRSRRSFAISVALYECRLPNWWTWGTKPETRVEAALIELCVVYGFCLPPDEAEALLADPPQELDAFVDAVLVAEGFPTADLCDAKTVGWVRGVLRDWLFDDGDGKGTRSGLPFALNGSA
jgi:hypothetical protein